MIYVVIYRLNEKYKNILNARLGKQSGARCTDMELNKTIIPRLNHVLNYLKIKTIKYEKYNIQKNIYCLLYEMILRHTTTINPNEVWFLSPEESIYSDIQNLSFDSDTDDWTKKTKVILDKMK
jgi:predicted ferric reductase